MNDWSAKRLDESQTAMFDVVMGEVVPSLKRCDRRYEVGEVDFHGEPRYVVVDATGEIVRGSYLLYERAAAVATERERS